jgi:hypothetical protein
MWEDKSSIILKEKISINQNMSTGHFGNTMQQTESTSYLRIGTINSPMFVNITTHENFLMDKNQ